MITIAITQQILAPVELVSQALLDHAQLNRFFNAEIKLIKKEHNGELSGGKGAVRQIAIGKITFEEQIISASIEHICYRIIGNKPVAQHQGDIRLTTLGDGKSTQLDYIITFKGWKCLPDFLLKFFVARDIKNAMKKLALHFDIENTSTLHPSKGASV